MIGMVIREATLNQIDRAFGLPYTSDRDLANRVRFGGGYVITESAINEIKSGM